LQPEEENMGFTSDTSAPNDGTYRGHSCGFGWKPIELVAMILAFILYWPIGLAILFAKIWQMKSGYGTDLPGFVQAKLREKFREKWEQKMGRHWACGPGRHEFSDWPRHGHWRMRSSGNLAFDDWREAELARLEEERQKLLAAEREFAEFMDNLRRAKDREEFDRFMAARRNRPSDGGAPNQPAS
jgi:hypothetical protein